MVVPLRCTLVVDRASWRQLVATAAVQFSIGLGFESIVFRVRECTIRSTQVVFAGQGTETKRRARRNERRCAWREKGGHRERKANAAAAALPRRVHAR